MRASRTKAAAVVAVAAIAVTCRPQSAAVPAPGPTPAPVTKAECELLPEPAESAGEITVALLDEVSAGRAPWPQNPGERLLFRHLYETLIRVDCQDSVHPGLAESWRAAGAGRVWKFTLRQDARFWDGVTVTADAVAASWSGGGIAELAFAAGIDSIVVEDDRVLAVHLDRPHPDVPRLFADPEFAVAQRSDESYWPHGTVPGGMEAGAVVGEHEIDNIVVRLQPPSPERPVISFLTFPDADARDVLRGGYDLLVTGDRSVAEYAATWPSYQSVPLPWDRSYVLLSTTRVRELRGGGELGPLAADFLEALAEDAVRGDARGHRSPAWWDDIASCGALTAVPGELPRVPPGAYRTSGPRRVVYRSGDTTARDLANRIVALAAEGAGASERAASLAAAVPGLAAGDARLLAVALAPEALDASLRYGDEFAYVVAVPRIVLDPCFAARKLVSRVEWLASQEVDLAASLIPLVDTRRQVIATRGRVRLTVDWDGTVLVSGAYARGDSSR